jgi:hypothetical protein
VAAQVERVDAVTGGGEPGSEPGVACAVRAAIVDDHDNRARRGVDRCPVARDQLGAVGHREDFCGRSRGRPEIGLHRAVRSARARGEDEEDHGAHARTG